MSRYYWLSLFFIYLFNFSFDYQLKAGIRRTNQITKWIKIDKDSFIDTKEFSLSNNFLQLNIKTKGYDQVALTLDCKNLTYNKRAGKKETIFKPIIEKTNEYNLASELCFLTGVEGFYKENRPSNYAKIIIKRYAINPKKYVKSENYFVNNKNNYESEENINKKQLKIIKD